MSDADKEAFKSLDRDATFDSSVDEANLRIYGAEELYRMYRSVAEAMPKMDNICRDDLPNVKCPVLILHGNADNWIRIDHPKYLEANIPNARVHYFPEGKHFIHKFYAEEFNKLIESFVRQ